jgi:very-short-patch-repair endonuclease
MEAVRMHRTALLGPPGDACDPVPTALAVAAMCQSRLDAVVSLDSALNQGFVSLATLHAEFSSLSAGHRRYLDLVDPTSGSGLETKARLRLRSHRVGLRTQVRIEGVGLVDLLIGDRLVLEVDGYRWHSSRQSFNEDRRRDLELAHRGYRVVRLSYEQVTFDWAACERVLLDLVRRDVHRWPVRSGGESRR